MILISCSEGELIIFFACKLFYCTGVWPFGRIERVRNSKCSMFNSLVPRPNPHAGKRVWCTSSDFLGLHDAKCHVILIIGMATHCLVCRSRMQQQCGLICAAGALSHEKSHAVNLIGAPEIGTATSSSPRNRSKYTRPSSPCRGGVWDRDYMFNELERNKIIIYAVRIIRASTVFAFKGVM